MRFNLRAIVPGIFVVLGALGGAALGSDASDEGRRSIWHINGYGQSLSVGTLGVPVLTTEPSRWDIMFREGIRRPPKRAPMLDQFIPLAETKESARGETSIAAAAETFRRTLGELRGGGPERVQASILGSSTGRAGARLKALRPASPNYEWLIKYAEAGAELAGEDGRDYRYLATLMLHGETDQLIGTQRLVYSEGLEALAESISRDTAKLSKDGWSPPLLVYQPSSHRAYLARDRATASERPEIALAVRDAAEGSDLIYCVMPLYFGDFADGVHAKNVTYQHIGKFFGRALAKLVHALETMGTVPPLALDLKTAIWAGSQVRLSFAVPVPPLEFDIEWVKQAPNMGFDLWAKDGSLERDAISAVSITSPTDVTISFKNAPSEGSRLSYAFGRPGDPERGGRIEGPRGNLRDSEGGAYTDPYGTVRPMANWALIFETVKQ